MTQVISHRVFEPGTAGWTVEDLHEPEIQRLWSDGRFEIIDGVLTQMAPQGIEGVDPLSELRDLVKAHLNATNQKGIFHHEVDLLLRRDRIVRPDLLYLTAEMRQRQRQLQEERKPPKGRYHPVYVTPLLVVESVSEGHEKHDRVTKHHWYAEAGIPHYWILTAHERSLVCLLRDNKRYVEESTAVGNDLLRSSVFGGIALPLTSVWAAG